MAGPGRGRAACGRGVGARPGRGDPGRHRRGTCRPLGARRLAVARRRRCSRPAREGRLPAVGLRRRCPTSPPASKPPRPTSTTSPTSCVCAPTRSAEDPERLEAVRARLRLFVELRRKYGSSLAEVVEFERSGRAQLADLEGAEETRAALEQPAQRRGRGAASVPRSASGPSVGKRRPSLPLRSRRTCTSSPCQPHVSR